MHTDGRAVGTNAVLLGERPTFESQLPLARYAFTKYRNRFPEIESDDLYQHCMLGMWLAYKEFDFSRGTKWSSYAMRRIWYELTYIKNGLVGGQKREGRDKEVLLSHFSYESVELASPPNNNEMELTYMRIAVHKLKRSYRRIVMMFYGLQMSCGEIGKVEGITRQRVGQKLKCAIKTLKSATGLMVEGE